MRSTEINSSRYKIRSVSALRCLKASVAECWVVNRVKLGRPRVQSRLLGQPVHTLCGLSVVIIVIIIRSCLPLLSMEVFWILFQCVTLRRNMLLTYLWWKRTLWWSHRTLGCCNQSWKWYLYIAILHTWQDINKCKRSHTYWWEVPQMDLRWVEQMPLRRTSPPPAWFVKPACNI